MSFEVTEAGAEFARGGLPDERRGNGIEAIVELRCAHAKRAQVVADHRYVVQPVRDLAPRPNAGSVRGPEELVGH